MRLNEWNYFGLYSLTLNRWNYNFCTYCHDKLTPIFLIEPVYNLYTKIGNELIERR